MSEGLPLLCREDEALDGVLEAGKNGLIYQDRESFLKHAERLLTDSKFRKQMRAGSAEKAETFSSDDFARSVLSLYETVITTDKVS
jgi:1,2-diacylglycerol 3-alpha-glucosyltransferase